MDSYYYVYLSYGMVFAILTGFIAKIYWERKRYSLWIENLEEDDQDEA